jgi:hypothetical protein
VAAIAGVGHHAIKTGAARALVGIGLAFPARGLLVTGLPVEAADAERATASASIAITLRGSGLITQSVNRALDLS